MAKLIDVSHLLVFDYEEKIGNITQNFVALVNGEAISEDEAIKMIKAGEYSPHILSMTLNQWKSIFKGKD